MTRGLQDRQGRGYLRCSAPRPDRINTAAVTSSSPGSRLFFYVSWIVLYRRRRTIHLDTRQTSEFHT